MTAPVERIGSSGRLADGQWHRLHPATPLLRGGIALVAILGAIVVNLRDILINIAVQGSAGEEYGPFFWLVNNQYAGWIVAAILIGLVLFVGGFALSWRMHTFRITDDEVEVRSGILFRTSRRGRLDRIQGINIVRPIFARLFGAARLEVDVAGQNGNVQLAYLGSAAADELRREILLLASGTRSAEQRAAADAQPYGIAQPGFIGQRVGELLAPELDPDAAPPESVVQMHLGRLLGSLVLSGFTVMIVVVVAVLVTIASTTGEFVVLIGFLPVLIGFGGFYVSRFTRSLRYSIASTPDGIRVGFGLLSLTNETLPPGRIHAIQVSQPLLWRPAGWWEIKINRASSSHADGAAGQANTTILPVGNRSDVHKVLRLVLPGLGAEALELLERGLVARGGGGGFITSPRRSVLINWFSWRRNGYAVVDGAVLARTGAIWRQLVIVPAARMQSVSIYQGPLLRLLRLGSLHVHTVAGPVVARVGGLDRADVLAGFGEIADAAVRSAASDTTHRWRRGTS